MATRAIRKPILCAAIILAASAAPARADLPITTLASFTGTNGANPCAGLTLSPDGSTLYGTTFQGGASNYGTVFSVPAAGGTPTVLASFNGTNGEDPHAGLTLSGNTLYGTTSNGGPSAGGTVFSVPVAGGTPTVLASFNLANGANPEATLTLSGNTLYATTLNGGAYGAHPGYGTVFSVPITGGTPTVLASFNGANGANPSAGVTLLGSTLYGTSWGAAIGNYGTVFSVPITGGTPTVLASFNGTNGQFPVGDLTLSADGNTLYGSTHQGGASYGGSNPVGYGTVFSVPIIGGTPTVLASFDGTNGQWPEAGLTLAGDTLYGTTYSGGAGHYGTVFSVPITGGTPTVLASFNGTNGANPWAGLTLSGNMLYGTTFQGGSSGYGTVFSIDLTSVPEPATLLLLSLATPALLLRRHPRKT